MLGRTSLLEQHRATVSQEEGLDIHLEAGFSGNLDELSVEPLWEEDHPRPSHYASALAWCTIARDA